MGKKPEGNKTSAKAGEVRANRLVDLRGPGKAKVLKRAQRKYKIFGNQNLPRMKEQRSQILPYPERTGWPVPAWEVSQAVPGHSHHKVRWICITPQESFDLNIQTSK